MPSRFLYQHAHQWLNNTSHVRSVVLFGSSARNGVNSKNQQLSDIDLHVISSSIPAFQRTKWECEFPDEELCLKTWRSATGGVTKLTLIFVSGQIDMVVISSSTMRIAQTCYWLGLFRKPGRIQSALNEMATCLHQGYKFLKGEERWGGFYERISRLPGVRLSDREIVGLANASVCDALWIFQKINGGEIIAAQHVFHSRMVDVNLRLWREAQLRNTPRINSFGLGRHIEKLADQSDLRVLSTNNALATPDDIRREVWVALTGLQKMMSKLVTSWSINERTASLLLQYSVPI